MALKFKAPFGPGTTKKTRAKIRGRPLIRKRDELKQQKRLKQLRTPGQRTRRT